MDDYLQNLNHLKDQMFVMKKNIVEMEELYEAYIWHLKAKENSWNDLVA